MWQLFLQLWQLLNSRRRDYFITHIQSHSGLLEGLALDNEKADQFMGPLWASASSNTDKFAQARRAHELFHQGAKVLHNLGYHYTMPEELSQLVRNVRV